MAQRSNRTQTALPVFLVAGSNQGLAGTYASGEIEFIAQGSLTDGQTLTLDDGINTATVFEFDVSGNGVTAGRVAIDVSGDTSAADVAATALTAINGASDLNLSASISTATLTITNTVKGDQGNVTTWASNNATLNSNITQPTGGEANLVGSGNAFGIADRQLGVVAAGSNGEVRDNDFISSGDTVARVPAISIVQGTPNSNNLSAVSAFGHTHKAVVKSAPLSKQNVLSVSTRKYELGKYDIDYISGVGTPVVGQKYALTVTLDSARTQITHGDNRETLQSTVEIGAGNNNVSYLLRNLAIKFNEYYSKFYAGGGNHPVVALGIGTGGTAAGTLTRSSVITFQNTGTAQTFGSDTKLVNSLNAAIAADSDLSSTVTINTLTDSVTLTGLLIVVLHEDTLEVVDTLKSVQGHSEVTIGATDFADTQLAATVTKVSRGSTGTNTGRQVSLEFDRRARQVAFSLENYVNHNEYPLRAPTYVDANAEGYNVTVIEAKNVDDKPMSPLNHHFQQVFICLPAAVSNPNADADTGYTIATTQTDTVTALNTDLTPWLASTDAQFKGDATSSAVFS